MKQEELNEVLRKHKLWLEDKEGGERANLRNANLRNANLYNADLYNANLRNVKGILQFAGEERNLIYYKYNCEYRIKVGCVDEELSYTLKNFESIGLENGYSKEHIKLYGDIIKLFSQYDL